MKKLLDKIQFLYEEEKFEHRTAFNNTMRTIHFSRMLAYGICIDKIKESIKEKLDECNCCKRKS